MRKIPLMIISVSLLFLGIGGVVRQFEKYFNIREEKTEFVTVSPTNEIRKESHQFVIVTKQPEDDSKVRVNIEAPPVPPAPNGETVREFRLERQPDSEPLKVITSNDDSAESNDFRIYKKESDEADGTPKIRIKEMRIIIKKDKKDQ